MIFDLKNMFSDGQVVTDAAASAKYVDAGPGIKNIGVGGGLECHVQAVEDFNNLATLKVEFQQDDDSEFGDPDTLVETGAIALADLKAGYVFNLPLPFKITKRYLRLYYTPAGGTTPTTGKITAGLVTDRDGGEHPDLTAE